MFLGNPGLLDDGDGTSPTVTTNKQEEEVVTQMYDHPQEVIEISQDRAEHQENEVKHCKCDNYVTIYFVTEKINYLLNEQQI